VDLLAMLNAPPPLDPDALDAYADERIRTFWSLRLPRPPFERILEHIDHAVQVAGIDHVGIGSDLDSGAVPTPVGLDSVSDYPRITEGLLRRGYAEADVAKVLGENFLRVYRAAVG
jgi:microsomal dipeptidase-like Zn-dependent dipeptidase